MTLFDIAVIGCGVAGSFAVHRIAKEHKDVKVIVFDTGRPPQKRRLQCQGFLGILPNSDGKFYHTDLDNVSSIIGVRKANAGFTLFKNIFENVCTLKTIKDRNISLNLEKRLKKADFEIQSNNYFQIYPKEVHSLSKLMTNDFDLNKNITFSFDNEIISISKQKGMFIIQSNEQEYRCKKILFCVGRSGWRQAASLYQNFGIIEDNNTAKFGVRIEMPAASLKEFNRSNLTLRNKQMEIGPFCWGGTVIPEDHIDMAISAFRSNEARWKTDKVSFQLITNITTENNGYQQTDRIGQLTFILTNDRILKERVSSLINRRSVILNTASGSIISEYEAVRSAVQKFGEIVPEILTKAYYHIPTVVPLPPQINIGSNFLTDIEGFYVAGESAGVIGLLAAAVSGLVAANEICK